MAVDGWVVIFCTARTGLGGLQPRPVSPLLAVPNVIAHPPMPSVPITVLLYAGPFLCGFNVAIKWLSTVSYFCLAALLHTCIQNSSMIA